MTRCAAIAALLGAVFCAVADDPSASAPASAPSGTEPAKVAVQQKAMLAHLASLRFEVQVFEEAVQPDGRVAPREELGRAKVWMTPDRIRTEVYQGEGGEPIFVLVDDGTRVTEWTAKEWCEYAAPARGEPRSVVLRDAFPLGCPFGSYLSSWLGPGTERGRWLGTVLEASRYRGPQELNGSPCDLFEYESVNNADKFLVNHKLWINRSREFAVQWATCQAQLSRAGKVVSEITRTRVYRDIDLAKVPATLFIARPPREAVRRGATVPPSSQPTSTNSGKEPSTTARQD
jgi:hypothetical protein